MTMPPCSARSFPIATGALLATAHFAWVLLAFAVADDAQHSPNVDSSGGMLSIVMVYGIDFPLAALFEALKPKLSTYHDRWLLSVWLFLGGGTVFWFFVGAFAQSLWRIFSHKRRLNVTRRAGVLEQR